MSIPGCYCCYGGMRCTITILRWHRRHGDTPLPGRPWQRTLCRQHVPGSGHGHDRRLLHQDFHSFPTSRSLSWYLCTPLSFFSAQELLGQTAGIDLENAKSVQELSSLTPLPSLISFWQLPTSVKLNQVPLVTGKSLQWLMHHGVLNAPCVSHND